MKDGLLSHESLALYAFFLTAREPAVAGDASVSNNAPIDDGIVNIVQGEALDVGGH